MILVLGSGIAGTAAALTARREGQEVTLVKGASGATVLGSVAIDDVPWDEAQGDPPALGEDAEAVLAALDLHRVTNARAIVATIEGTVRPARGIDRAALDLAHLPRGVVIVPAMEREGWDAPAIAHALSEAAISRARGLVFESVAAQLLLRTEERTIPDAEIAARYDDESALKILAERMRELPRSPMLLPPWLGVSAPRAEALSALVGVPCGEIASCLSLIAGARFVQARDRALAAAKIEVVPGMADAIAIEDDMCIVQVKGGSALQADAVVVATGGLIGGGIVYTPSEAALATAMPRTPSAPFACSIAGAGVVGVHGEPFVLPGSLFGIQPEALAWPFVDPPPMEMVGLISTPARVFAAGDVLADRRRTFLAALRAGVTAGRDAARIQARQRAAS